MKTAPAIALFLAFFANAAHSQGKATQAELQAKYDKKITAKYIAHGGWMLDYDAARAKAKAEGKLIFAYFTRSYSP